MPLSIEPRPGSTVLAPGAPGASARPRANSGARALRIGLLNNMPDAALENTESQFTQLLQRAAPDRSISLRLASLPQLERSAGARQHMQRSYWRLEELLREPLDALIVTGTEPRASQLSDEPYWDSLRRVIDWAESNTASTLWSCLAAHAAVQYLDGIARRRLPEKCCGVFAFDVAAKHPLARGLPAPLYTPHSRWNELPREPLEAAGYEILSQSRDGGVNLFVRQRDSLFLFVQGHPEYEDHTLLKEYRRDVGRFLKGQQPHYPSLPHGYLSGDLQALLLDFQRAAVADPSPERLEAFPYAACAAGLAGGWGAGAARLYANWLEHIAAAHTAGHRRDRRA